MSFNPLGEILSVRVGFAPTRLMYTLQTVRATAPAATERSAARGLPLHKNRSILVLIKIISLCITNKKIMYVTEKSDKETKCHSARERKMKNNDQCRMRGAYICSYPKFAIFIRVYLCPSVA